MTDDVLVPRRILLVEDEESLILTLQDRLESERYEVTVARDGDVALETGSRRTFDCIVLDIALPRRNGFDVCRDLRNRGVQTPILMLTARGQVIDRILGLKLGADDYLTKPFEMLELLARIEALLRRSRTLTSSSADVYSFGSVEVDFRRAEVRRGSEAIEISALELKLLRYLVEHRGSVLSRDELLEKVWGYDATPVTRTVDVHIGSLRQKIGAEFILTVHGLGYKLVG
jgi:two-component system, OmpR family, alkaline phosphatase synthesis response regulator PhoP